MTNTIPERTATQLELARETTRGIPCEHCGAVTGYSCDGHGGMHLGRHVQAYRLGLMGEDRMAAVLAPLTVFVPDMLIPGGAS